MNKCASDHYNLVGKTLQGAMYATADARSLNEYYARALELSEQIKKYINLDSRVLDFGCGIGRMEKLLADYCKDIVAVDASDIMLGHARELHGDISNVSFIKSDDSFSLNYLEKNSFDFAFTLYVLQHMDKTQAIHMLYEIKKVIRKGAIIFAQFPNVHSPNYAAWLVYYGKVGNMHNLNPNMMRYWDGDEIYDVFNLLGFKNISVTFYDEYDTTVYNKNDVNQVCKDGRIIVMANK